MRVGDYIIERELSEDTFEATHVLLPRRVLLRMVGPDRATAVAMMREACILEALHHPGVPRLYECGRAGDRTWAAIELVTGRPVTTLAVDGVIALVRDVASILEHAHARGITHGNVRRDAIVLRKHDACLIGWDDARLACAYPADVLALGELACELLASPVPAAFSELLAEMRAAHPGKRPSAADIAAIAAQIASELCEELDDVDLVEIELPAPISIPTPVPLRWTPPRGVSMTPPPGAVAIAALKLRS
jgi:hypothetical protein